MVKELTQKLVNGAKAKVQQNGIQNANQIKSKGALNDKKQDKVKN